MDSVTTQPHSARLQVERQLGQHKLIQAHGFRLDFVDLITGMGPGGTPVAALFDGLTLAELDCYLAYEPTFTGGIFVG